MRASGTLTTDGTEQTLLDLGSGSNQIAGIFKLDLDTRNLGSGDTVVLRAYKKAKVGGTLSKFVENTYSNAQTVPLKELDDLTCMRACGLKLTLQRTAGTDRSYDWAVESF